MLALVCDEAVFLTRERPRPERARGEARIAVERAGVCDTDLQLARGYMRYRGVLGHEFVGRVVETDDPAWLGRRVVGDINAGCGVCDECRLRGGHHCPRRSVLGILGRDGAFAEELTLPVRCLVPVPDDLPLDLAVFAEPLAAALHVLDVMPSDLDGPVLVVGDGKLGSLIAMVLHQMGSDVTCVGHHPAKLARLSAQGVGTALERDVVGQAGQSPFVVEATGSASGLALSLSMARPRGTVVLKTTLAGVSQVDLSKVVVDELSLLGSRCGDMERAVRWLEQGRVDPRCLVAARFPLARADEALRHAAARGVLKVLIDVGEVA